MDCETTCLSAANTAAKQRSTGEGGLKLQQPAAGYPSLTGRSFINPIYIPFKNTIFVVTNKNGVLTSVFLM